MVEQSKVEQTKSTEEQKAEPKVKPEDVKPEDMGMLDSYGSFPIWLLKGIQLVTPEFLISKTPPPKPKVRN
ncbi:MAG: hypothetical protein G3M78_04825 [Candidatus Nitrohelix vancouverensis]|uniref:Uncharacterized protein n=1 Tax=Candidatus Nitrohelix vancouverensis TaxID=2705534 RepID=A0A7T0G241_9BACT|nr:MAG: hypothetical protein G3M78_04825 [Candidatus Nitrohelix vancouverensis]